jgi:glycosyltransferase involved in cell wall biosynthesis
MERILFLVTSGDIGGAQRNVLFSAQKSKKEGFEVLVGSGSRGWLSEELKKKEIPFLVFKNLKRSFNPFSALLFVLELRKFLKKEKIDVINFNSSNTLSGVLGLLGLKQKPKTVFTIHGWSYLSPGFKKSKIIKIIYWLAIKILLPFIDEVVFICNYDKELAKKLGLIKKNQGRVVYNEIEKIDFLEKNEAINELRKKKEFPADKIIVGTITRLEYAKNNEFLIEGFSRLPKEILDKTICLIIGSGPEEQNIKSQISNLKINDKVFLLGDISNASKYLKVFDIFIITSRYEGLPYALLEAMSAGLKIIATRVGGITEVLEEKGILIEPDSVNELVNNLTRLLS